MKKRSMKCISIFSVLLLSISCHALATNKGSVRIRVGNTDNGVIPEVQIVCKNSDGKIVHQARTSQTGEAVIGALLEGTYTIFFEKQGYDSHSKKVRIRAKAELYTNIIMFGGGAESKVRAGIFPMKVKLGPPQNTDMFAIGVKGPLEDDNSKSGEIQFDGMTVSMEQFPYLLQSLKQSIWLQIEGNVSYSQLISVLEIFYRFQKTEQVYLSIASPEDWVLPIRAMRSPTTGLTMMVADSTAKNQGLPVVDATVQIIGETPAKQNTDTNGVVRFVDIQPGMYTVKVTEEGYQPQEAQITVQPEMMEILRIHLISTDTASVITQPRLPSSGLELQLPVAANMKVPDQQYSMLLLDRSKVSGFQSGSVDQIITSVQQMQSIFRQARFKSLLIAADRETDSRWIVGILKHASDAKFTEFHFIVQ